MINTKTGPCRRYWADGELTKIENYDKAIADTTQVWDCHHRLEVQDGEEVSRSDLIKQGLYYHRPAEELIFLTHSEHKKLHSAGKYKQGDIPWNKGKKMSEAYRESCKKGWITRKKKRKSQK